MTQTWDPKKYAANGSFVHEMAGGVVEWLDVRPGESILDLGCGDGQLTAQLAAAGALVRGVDASVAMAAAARALGVDAVAGTAEALPFAGASFDAVFSNAALHWVRDQGAMMREVRRVLRPGGRFVAEMGGQGNIAAIRVALTAALAEHGLDDCEAGVNYFPTPASYTERLGRHGFCVERMELSPRPTPLADEGMSGWLRTFRRGVLESVPEPLREQVVERAVALLRPVLCDEAGKWTADYVRLRFVARA